MFTKRWVGYVPHVKALLDGDTEANVRGFQNNSYKCSLVGKLKVWLGYLSRLTWPLPVYEVAKMRVRPWSRARGSCLRERAWCKEDCDKCGPIY